MKNFWDYLQSTTTYQVIADEITYILAEQKQQQEAEVELFREGLRINSIKILKNQSKLLAFPNFEPNLSDTQRIIKQLTTDLISQQCGINERGLTGQDNLLKINRDRQFAEETLGWVGQQLIKKNNSQEVKIFLVIAYARYSQEVLLNVSFRLLMKNWIGKSDTFEHRRLKLKLAKVSI